MNSYLHSRTIRIFKFTIFRHVRLNLKIQTSFFFSSSLGYMIILQVVEINSMRRNILDKQSEYINNGPKGKFYPIFDLFTFMSVKA